MGDVFSIFALSLLAMVNPTLLAAVAIMMLLPEPRRLIAGYLVGAWLASIGVGLAIVFSFHSSAGVESTQKTLSPLADVVIGALLVLVGWALMTGRVTDYKAHRRERKEAKHGPAEQKESLPERLLGRGSVRVTFAVGVVFSFPGASYIVALHKISLLDWPTGSTVLAVVIFCLIQQLLLEVPLIGFYVAPERTSRMVVRFRDWISHNAVRTGGRVALVLGALLIIRGVVYLVAG